MDVFGPGDPVVAIAQIDNRDGKLALQDSRHTGGPSALFGAIPMSKG